MDVMGELLQMYCVFVKANLLISYSWIFITENKHHVSDHFNFYAYVT